MSLSRTYVRALDHEAARNSRDQEYFRRASGRTDRCDTSSKRLAHCPTEPERFDGYLHHLMFLLLCWPISAFF